MYNKIVSNFEAGEIREQFGGHLADYVDCPNEHLQKTFASPDVQARGCTRIEVSLYAFSDRTPETADEVVESVLQLVSPKSGPLFLVQPAIQQYKNFAKAIDRCFVLADRPEGYIYVCWYAHTKTKRLAGIRIQPSACTVEKDNLWKKAIDWSIGDFGFRNCPIFFAEILLVEEDTFHISNLQCYTKNKNTKTILAACRKPTQVRKTTLDPKEYLPSTDTIEWTWRKTKCCNAIGVEASKYTFQEMPEIAAKRSVSLLSTRKREYVLEQIEEELQTELWKEKANNLLVAMQKEHQENIQKRREELEDIQKRIEENEEHMHNSAWMRCIVEQTLRKDTQPISILSGQKWAILGYRKSTTSFPRVVVGKYEGGIPFCIWANTKLAKLLEETKKYMEIDCDKYERTIAWLPREYPHLYDAGEECKDKDRLAICIQVGQQKSFVAKDQKNIFYYPVEVVELPTNEDLPSIREKILEEMQDQTAPHAMEYLHECENAPISTLQKNTKDLECGVYMCRKYAETVYRKKSRIVLFLVPTQENGMPTTDVEIPTYGYFVEKEIERMGGIEALYRTKQPILCRIGSEKTTANNKKEKQFYIVADVEKEKVRSKWPMEKKYWVDLVDLEPGEYYCDTYSFAVYRKKKKYFLHLYPKNTKDVVHTYGKLLQEEVERVGIENIQKKEAPMVCIVGSKRRIGRKEEREIQIV